MDASGEIRFRKGKADLSQERPLQEGDDPYDDDDDDKEKKAEKDAKPVSPYNVQNFCWIIAAIAIFYYTDFASRAIFDPEINKPWRNIGAILIAVHIAIAMFLIGYLSCFKKLTSDEWDNHYPSAVPLATACFAFGSFCLTVGLWPVWGFLTPIILFAFLMAAVVVIAMLPNF